MGRSRGLLWLVAGLFLALIAGILAFQAINRATVETAQESPAAGPLTTVVVAARDVPVRTQLVAEDVRAVEVPAGAVPPGAVTNLDDAVGRIATADLFEGETLLAARLLDPTVVSPDGRLALMMVDDQYLMAIPAVDTLSRVRVLKPGDRVDVLTSLDFTVRTAGGAQQDEQDVQATFIVLQNVAVAGLVGPNVAPVRTTAQGEILEQAGAAAQPVPDALLLTLAPQDALALKYAIDAGGIMDFVLRAPGVDRPFDTDAVDADYLDNRYDLPLEPGQ